MSATDELRSLLDERGIEHYDHDHSDVRVTEWSNGGKRDARYEEWSSGTVRFDASNVTAEQAIVATVGRGTCHTVSMDCFGNPPYNQSGLNGNDPACGCSECGAPWSTTGLFRGNKLRHNFKACPICGRRIVG